MVLCLALLLVACSKPRLDASSDEALTASLLEVQRSLDEADRAEFNEFMSQATAATALGGLLGGNKSMASLLQPLDGMTGEEAVAFMRGIKAKKEAARVERELQELEKAKARLAELLEEEAAHQQGLSRLEGILISDAEIREEGKGYGRTYSMNAKLKNTLDVPLASISFKHAVRSPDRAVAWREGEGTFFIDGGLEPGEERAVRATGGFGGFILESKALRENPGARLHVTISGATGADKTSIVPPALNSYSAKELQGLREKLAGG